MIALAHGLHGEEMGQGPFWEIVFIKCPLKSKASFLLTFMSPGSVTVVTIETNITGRGLLLRDDIEVVEEIIKMFLAIRDRQKELSLPTKSSSLWSGNHFGFSVC